MTSPVKQVSQTWFGIEGAASPLGVIWIEEQQAYNFALYSRHASVVTLLLYSEQDVVTPRYEIVLSHLRNKSSRVWHCRIRAADMPGCKFYAYRADGPAGPGHAFDTQKILLDPYAKVVFFPKEFSRNAAKSAGSNAGKAPLGVIDPDRNPFDWGDDRRPRHTSDTVIYEMHVKGFTKRANSGVAPAAAGTYAGVTEKIPYLRDLGVSVVELLPVYQYEPEEGGNYWGYMPLNFFAPHLAYSHSADVDQLLNEFRAMVKAFHEAAIEVVLDVVYNHTTEADAKGPNYSYRGIDNSTYYLLTPDLQHYRNEAGTGNVLRTSHPTVRKLIMDSLRFWVKQMHVDGFRFDLASIFTRNDDGSINIDDPPVIADISHDPDFADIRLIAEPWDLGTYQLGRQFPGLTWAQWNGKFRDDIRAFVKGDNGTVAPLMSRLYGSDDLFPDTLETTYHPYQSINFINSHDGFNLRDLVSYNGKHNEANGHNNSDGPDYNLSWNCGWEGDQNVPQEVVDLRKRQIKNFCCLLFLSNGTPMFCAGDEFMNTQRGNNNPYNQDNETTWLDWDLLEKNKDVLLFFKKMISFRKMHPSLSRSRFWRQDISWYGIGANPDLSYNSHTLACCIRGALEKDNDIYVMVNSYWEDLTFSVQEGAPDEWKRVIDTNLPSPADFNEPGGEQPLKSNEYLVRARSVVVLLR
jgi:isoamylase